MVCPPTFLLEDLVGERLFVPCPRGRPARHLVGHTCLSPCPPPILAPRVVCPLLFGVFWVCPKELSSQECAKRGKIFGHDDSAASRFNLLEFVPRNPQVRSARSARNFFGHDDSASSRFDLLDLLDRPFLLTLPSFLREAKKFFLGAISDSGGKISAR